MLRLSLLLSSPFSNHSSDPLNSLPYSSPSVESSPMSSSSLSSADVFNAIIHRPPGPMDIVDRQDGGELDQAILAEIQATARTFQEIQWTDPPDPPSLLSTPETIKYRHNNHSHTQSKSLFSQKTARFSAVRNR